MVSIKILLQLFCALIAMATPVKSVDEILERELTTLVSHVQQEKDRASGRFRQLHSLLAEKEQHTLQEMDGIVEQAKHEFTEKRGMLGELHTAKESTERDLITNRLRDVLEKNLLTLEDKIREELSRSVSVGWVELDWKMEAYEKSVSEVCKVITLKESPFKAEDYSLKLRLVWSREGTGPGEIRRAREIAIDSITQNIFVVDKDANTIQVFNEQGIHLYKLNKAAESPNGIALTEEFIFVSGSNQLVKIRKSNRKSVKSIQTEKRIWGIETDASTNIYGCENENKSVIVYDSNLEFLKRIKLETSQIKSDTQTHSIKLYGDRMYVMFGEYHHPIFHLQIFSLEGELERCLIPKSEIEWSYFFSIDKLGNIIVADWGENQIKIFNKEGEPIHTITSDMLPGDMKFDRPTGIAINNKNAIIVAQVNKACCLLAFQA